MSNRYAVVDGGVVENVILAGPNFSMPGKALVPVGADAVGAGWTYVIAGGGGGGGGKFSPPAAKPPGPRIVDGAGFLALFTPAEVAALWGADPRLMAAALRVAAQNECNLDSPELTQLLGLAVVQGAILPGRVPQITAGMAPT